MLNHADDGGQITSSNPQNAPYFGVKVRITSLSEDRVSHSEDILSPFLKKVLEGRSSKRRTLPTVTDLHRILMLDF